jgi:tetratricopeptide (TPR) repeat protein
LKDTLQLQGEVARDIAEGISANLLGLSGRHPLSSYPLNVDAYDDYLKGRNYVRRITQADAIRGIEFLDRSIQRDPNYAPAYVEVSLAYQMLTWLNHSQPRAVFPKAKAAATKALTLDENLAEAHSMLGLIRGGYEWDWAAGERELRRGIELDPNSSFAHFAYALDLVTVRRKTDAIREVNTALELDPFSPFVHSCASFVFLAARQYDAAIREARRTVEIDPNFADGHLSLAAALGAKGTVAEAFAEWLRYLNLDGDAELGQELERAARKISGPGDPGQKLAGITINYYQRKSQTQYVAALTMVGAFVDLGDKDKTFEWLNKAYQEHSNGLGAIAVEPAFDPLRSDPRFQDLLRRMNLPVDSVSTDAPAAVHP